MSSSPSTEPQATPKGGRKCWVSKCAQGSKVLFPVPADGALLRRWRRAMIGCGKKKLTAEDFLCERHFHRRDVREETVKVDGEEVTSLKLKETAVPSKTVMRRKKRAEEDPLDISDSLPVKLEVESHDDDILEPETIITTPDILPANDCPDDYEDLFSQLWTQSNAITLPSRSWAIHYIPQAKADNTICISQMCIYEGGPVQNTLTQKKIVLTSKAVTFFIVDQMVESEAILPDRKLRTLEDLQDFLGAFNNLLICIEIAREPPGVDNFSLWNNDVDDDEDDSYNIKAESEYID